ncbi:MAG TPA: nucleoside hydrolase [Stellaceae bacterium]|nr:nucleoside hydrolase [Stellaceae bacterium]
MTSLTPLVSRMAPRRIIIDTDPGIDDAVAILLALASSELDVEAVIAVAGNGPLAITERNARAICELAGRADVPVYAGCPRAVLGDMITATYFHGESGLGKVELPPPTVPLQAKHGVHFLIDRLRGAAPNSLTLCALGPLTNIAAAIIQAPDIIAAVDQLVLMGGASRALGNTSPAAEFNILADPHAAAIVFESGLPITMIPLDLTHQVRSTVERISRIRALGSRIASVVAALITPSGDQPYALHDPCVIAYVLAPELFQGAQVNVAVETHSALTLGATVVDWRGVSGRDANACVLHTVDVEGLYALLESRFR